MSGPMNCSMSSFMTERRLLPRKHGQSRHRLVPGRARYRQNGLMMQFRSARSRFITRDGRLSVQEHENEDDEDEEEEEAEQEEEREDEEEEDDEIIKGA